MTSHPQKKMMIEAEQSEELITNLAPLIDREYLLCYCTNRNSTERIE